MERTVHKTRSFQAAEEWDIAQQIRMTPQERWSAARRLKERVYGRAAKDVRACHRNQLEASYFSTDILEFIKLLI